MLRSLVARMASVVRRVFASPAPSPHQRCLTGSWGVCWRRDVWPGLVRYSLREQTKNAGWRVYVHRFSVTDSEIHNHPWAWSASLLVRGQYTEVLCDRGPTGPFRTRLVRWFNFIPVTRFHAVTGFPGDGRAVWTVFVCGRAVDPTHEGGQ